MTSAVARSTAVLLSLLLVIIAVGLGLWALTSIRSKVKENAHQSLQTVLDTSLEAMDIWVKDQQNELRTLAFHRRLVELSAAQLERYKLGEELLNSPELENLRELFRQYREVGEHIGFFVIAPDGTSVASLRDANVGSLNLIEVQRPNLLARAFAGETVLIPPIVSDVPLPGAANIAGLDRPATMFFATPLRNASREVFAVLTERFDPQADFTGINLLGRIGSSGETYSFDRHGRLLSESRFLDDLVTSGLIQTGEQGILSVELRDPGGNLVAGFTDALPEGEQPLTRMAASATAGEAGYDVDGYRDYRGVTVFGAWAWNEPLGIGMATEIDAAEAMGAYYNARFAIVAILAITVGVAIAFTSWLLVLASRTNRSRRKAKELAELISDIAASLAGLPASEIDRQIDTGLRRIGEFLAADRTALWEFRAESKVWARNHSWIGKGMRSPPMEEVSGEFPLIEATLLRGEVFQFSSRDELTLAMEHDLMVERGIQSLLLIPLKVSESIVGALGVGTARKRDWPDPLVSTLRMVGELFASVLARKRSEEDLRTSRGKLRTLASELVTLEERERRRIAIYLHDQIAQTLAVSRMKLGGLATMVDSADARQGVEEIRDLLEEAIDDTQELTFEVSPPILYELGLAPAIEWIGESFAAKYGLQVDFIDHTNNFELDSNLSALLFRATRELLMNVVKHAEARRAAVSLLIEDGTLRIEVKDDGIGFETSKLDPAEGVTSFGLSSVRERMDYAGGRVEFESQPGAGTRVCLIMPLPDAQTSPEGASR